MKSFFLTLAIACMTLVVNAQGKFEVKDFGKFKLHTYVTADPLGDMSHIVEGSERSRCLGTCRISVIT